MAFTATATQVVREDIVSVLELQDPFQKVTGFARANLSFNITPVETKAAKFRLTRGILDEYRTGIIYCATRKRVEEVSETLNNWGVKCIGYHGGMTEEAREETQDRFIRREEDVAVATNAFGMGIDRSDVRFVIHFEVPGSVEAVTKCGNDQAPYKARILETHLGFRGVYVHVNKLGRYIQE